MVEKIKNPYKFLISGDSISKGVIYDDVKRKYVVIENNYISLLQDKIDGIVYNTARFGNTLFKGVRKLKSDVETKNPDFVLIEYGGNDCDFLWNEIAENPTIDHKPKNDFNSFEKQLKDTIVYLKKSKVTPILLTLPPLNADRYFKWVSRNNSLAEKNIMKWLGSVTKIYWWQEKYNSIIIKIAEETNTRWIDIRGAFLQSPDYSDLLCIDGIHPNEKGHQIIANKIIDYIEPNYTFLLKNQEDVLLDAK